MKHLPLLLAYFFVLSCPAQTQDVATSVNKFSFDFYKTVLAKEKKNAFASAFSVSAAFAMVYAGAEGETLAEMSRTLYFQNTPDFHAKQAAFQENLQKSLPKGLALEVANALWIKKGFKFLPDYQDIMQKNYRAKLEPVNFDAPVEASAVINKWTSEKTHDKIKEIIKPEHIDDLTRLILTNAIYFKSSWAKSFDKQQTRSYPFALGAGKTEKASAPRENWINADCMQTQGFFKYFENLQLQMLELPYTDNSASMVVILPTSKSNLENAEKEFTYENYEKWASAMQQQDVRVLLPKFKIESDFSLNGYLQDMGIKRAFERGQAEFDKIIEKVPLHIGLVLHKSFVEVNEEGTEAAAVTAIIMQATESAHHEQPMPKMFFANRPFLFLIKDNKTGAILFMGKVLNPNK